MPTEQPKELETEEKNTIHKEAFLVSYRGEKLEIPLSLSVLDREDKIEPYRHVEVSAEELEEELEEHGIGHIWESELDVGCFGELLAKIILNKLHGWEEAPRELYDIRPMREDSLDLILVDKDGAYHLIEVRTLLSYAGPGLERCATHLKNREDYIHSRRREFKGKIKKHVALLNLKSKRGPEWFTRRSKTLLEEGVGLLEVGPFSKPKSMQILELKGQGLRPKEIARILGMKRNCVDAALSKMRKRFLKKKIDYGYL